MITNERKERPPVRPTFSIRLSPDLKERLRRIAKARHRSLNAQIEAVLEEFANRAGSEAD